MERLNFHRNKRTTLSQPSRHSVQGLAQQGSGCRANVGGLASYVVRFRGDSTLTEIRGDTLTRAIANPGTVFGPELKIGFDWFQTPSAESNPSDLKHNGLNQPGVWPNLTNADRQCCLLNTSLACVSILPQDFQTLVVHRIKVNPPQQLCPKLWKLVTLRADLAPGLHFSGTLEKLCK